MAVCCFATLSEGPGLAWPGQGIDYEVCHCNGMCCRHSLDDFSVYEYADAEEATRLDPERGWKWLSGSFRLLLLRDGNG
jgi:hypothetical protein